VTRPLTATERREGYARPVRFRVAHAAGCGAAQTLSRELAESFARWPDFKPELHCGGCGEDAPIGDFRWSDGTVVGA